MQPSHEPKLHQQTPQKRTNMSANNSEDNSSTDNSLSLPLPDNRPSPQRISTPNSISEHLDSHSESIEHDRSDQEIEISYLPSLTFRNPLADDQHSQIRHETPSSPPISSSTNENRILSPRTKNSNGRNVGINVQSILDEILRSEQFHSDHDETLHSSNPSSFNVFQDVDFDESLTERNVEKVDQYTIKQLTDLLSSKDAVIAALTAEIESFKELTGSNPSTISFNTNSTEYKQFQEELQHKTVELQTAINNREDVIQQLTAALKESISTKEKLEKQTDKLAEKVRDLQKQLAETLKIVDNWKKADRKEMHVQTEQISTEIMPIVDHYDFNLDSNCSQLEETLSNSQIVMMEQLKNTLNGHINEIVANIQVNSHQLKDLQAKFDNERMEHEGEVERLRELLSSMKCDSTDIVELRQQLELKHTKEMEELRTYFEQKCSDLEKHYSEEVFSQHSRKLSGSSTNSEQIDFVLPVQHRPGSGGDTADAAAKLHLSFEDVNTLRAHVAKLAEKLDQSDSENVDNEEIAKALETLGTYLKFDPDFLPKDEVNVQVDYEGKVAALHREYAAKIDNLESQYEAKIGDLKSQLNNALQSLNTAAQEVASSGEYELAEVVQSYERRLQQQVTLAKIDIINALEHQIQTLVATDATDENQWPRELLQLRNKFAEKYEAQIAQLEVQHTETIDRLKEEHLRTLNGAVERAKRRSLKDNEALPPMPDAEQCNNYQRTNSLLLQLVNDLLKYFGECENELNNTLVDQLLKLDLTANLPEMNLDESSNSTSGGELQSNSGRHRVHFTPQFEDVLNAIERSQPIDFESKDISIGVKNELDACLSRLRSEANAILLLSTNVTQNKAIASDGNDDLLGELKHARNLINCLEAEKDNLEREMEQLIAKEVVLAEEVDRCRAKITELIEHGHKEIVSEGYGDGAKSMSTELGETIASLSEVQEKARALLSDNADATNPLVQLIEQLVHEGDRFKDEIKRDRDDLNQQIKAADKKLRATCHFLEEQATEREQERDEHQKEILTLREQLRERERDRINCERINREVEHFEQQMRDMSKLIEEYTRREKHIESERNEALDKIAVLRDIVRDLEAQVEGKVETETELRDVISKLEEIIKHQNKSNEELHVQLESCKSGQRYRDEIDHLKDEIQRLNLNGEFVGSEGVLKQFKTQLSEIEVNLDKRTRDLETLHSAISNTTCSSPSEDMSVRDQIRPKTPNPLEECDVPLQQLARLKEKLIKHARVEDAAVKRIHDLEMQFENIKRELDEVQNERDLLQDQLSEQLVLISSLQIRLDDQRLRAEHVQKQTNNSLEVRIYDLEHEVKSLMETLHARDKTIKQLHKTNEETRTRLANAERELTKKMEEGIIVELEDEVERLRVENVTLKQRMENDANVLPGLVDNIISDKNKDIELLREKLDRTQSELNGYLSLNLDVDQLKALSRLQSSDRAFSDILTLLEPERMRKGAHASDNSLNASVPFAYKSNANETTFLGGRQFEPEISSIEHVGPANMNFTQCHAKPNSTELGGSKSMEKHVHFEEDELRAQLAHKDAIIGEFTARAHALSQLETNIDELQSKLDRTESMLREASEQFATTEKQLRAQLEETQVDVTAKKLQLADKEQEFALLKDDYARKDEMYLNLAREKRDLDKALAEIVANQLQPLQNELETKEGEIAYWRNQYHALEENMVGVRADLEKRTNDLNRMAESECKMAKDLTNKESQLRALTTEMDTLKTLIEAKTNEEKINELKVALADRETEIEILNEDVNRYLDDIGKLESRLAQEVRTIEKEYENKLRTSAQDVAQKQAELTTLRAQCEEHTRQIRHLHELINEKDKIINQMGIDSRSLHINLESIQNKLLETGNIIDLRKLLTEEQQLNASLRDEVKQLRASSSPLDTSNTQCRSLEPHNDVHALKERLAHLQAQLKAAESQCANAQETSRQLRINLTNEKQNSDAIQLEDAHMIRQLRVRLEGALERETEFEKELLAEKSARAELQLQVDALRQKVAATLSSENSKTDTEYKSLPNLDAPELVRTRLELAALRAEHAQLRNEVKSLKRAKGESEAHLKYAKDVLQLKVSEMEQLHARIEQLQQTEMELTEKLLTIRLELSDKDREVENTRTLITEIDQERNGLKKQLEKLLAGKALVESRDDVQEPFLTKIKELSNLVKEHIIDNNRISDTVERLTNERKILKQRIQSLEELNNGKLQLDDPVLRANHLFSRFLRSESYRKALIWQKRYLVALTTYQEESMTNPFLPPRDKTRPRRTQRFKIAVICVQSIVRMKYMVQRWHSGVRGMTYGGTQQKPRPFLVERAVTPPTLLAPEPWSGVTPPSKEKSTMHKHNNNRPLPHSRSTRNSHTEIPTLLSRYCEKIGEMRQRLDDSAETDSI